MTGVATRPYATRPLLPPGAGQLVSSERRPIAAVLGPLRSEPADGAWPGGLLPRSVHPLLARFQRQAALETVCALLNVIDARDHYTRGHSVRVGVLARLVGRALGLADPETQTLEWAGLLHDVGKLGVADAILNKQGRLTPAEFEQIKLHPQLGHEIVRPVSTLTSVLDAVLYHHENFDGSGYPAGLAGETIPLSARILRVVDIFDALTSPRPYRQALGGDEALDVLARDAGRVTDAHITRRSVQMIEQLLRKHPFSFRERLAAQAPPLLAAASVAS